jgi:hypothetical protein
LAFRFVGALGAGDSVVALQQEPLHVFALVREAPSLHVLQQCVTDYRGEAIQGRGVLDAAKKRAGQLTSTRAWRDQSLSVLGRHAD